MATKHFTMLPPKCNTLHDHLLASTISSTPRKHHLLTPRKQTSKLTPTLIQRTTFSKPRKQTPLLYTKETSIKVYTNLDTSHHFLYHQGSNTEVSSNPGSSPSHKPRDFSFALQALLPCSHRDKPPFVTPNKLLDFLLVL